MVDWSMANTDPERALDEAWKTMEAEKQKLERLGKHWDEATIKVRTKDQSFEMTFDGRGELTDLAFNGDRYRKLPPAQLARMIVDTVTKGRAEAQQKMNEVMGVNPVPGLDLEGVASGKVRPDELLESLLAPMMEGITSLELSNADEPSSAQKRERRHG
ncbi:YbaB/EbfC family nucleoid-associated protein [Amycolatopsis jejuensis]|uniref:YbaB/EbfC family nucleoid-associated protein n=1 Tax=Amycolatopsis jejuensis TaxID=330084 RepID=UPI0005271B54|nr:YbaB/EbfC family nucleoid-associated protein [Amycolatopsis jejuensis]